MQGSGGQVGIGPAWFVLCARQAVPASLKEWLSATVYPNEYALALICLEFVKGAKAQHC